MGAKGCVVAASGMKVPGLVEGHTLVLGMQITFSTSGDSGDAGKSVRGL